ncbi:uncharacterized protein METZ01_LOCUS458232 [marine metagenome]|uniref:Uncharacterized protein n=1 Tax=marine metagenome TaxID=408172 RepID=A0A383AE84_9ZZZZ
MALQECDGCKKEIIIYANEDTVCLHCGELYPKAPSIKLKPHVKQQVTIKLLENRIDTGLKWFIRIYTGIIAIGFMIAIFGFSGPFFVFTTALIFPYFINPLLLLIALIVRYLVFSKTYQK